MTIDVPQELRSQLAKPEMKNMKPWGIRTPTVIDSIIVGSGAEKAGLKPGDQIISVNDSSASFAHEFFKMLKIK